MSHRPLVCDIIKSNGFTYGAELGLGGGLLSSMIMQELPEVHLIGVDIMARPDRSYKVRQLASIYRDRYTLLEMTTDQAATIVDDGELDFVFIDAGHSYEAVVSDIKHWAPKVRTGGLIMGHDYGHPKYTGVAQAVDEAFSGVTVHGETIWSVPE